ncbi:MAG: hypothetical protein AVDCRST_MAG49-4512, partial [uncultured Thermomicrobiales bacterium]
AGSGRRPARRPGRGRRPPARRHRGVDQADRQGPIRGALRRPWRDLPREDGRTQDGRDV